MLIVVATGALFIVVTLEFLKNLGLKHICSVKGTLVGIVIPLGRGGVVETQTSDSFPADLNINVRNIW